MLRTSFGQIQVLTVAEGEKPDQTGWLYRAWWGLAVCCVGVLVFTLVIRYLGVDETNVKLSWWWQKYSTELDLNHGTQETQSRSPIERILPNKLMDFKNCHCSSVGI